MVVLAMGRAATEQQQAAATVRVVMEVRLAATGVLPAAAGMAVTVPLAVLPALLLAATAGALRPPHPLPPLFGRQ
jgi:hypothetical protein